MVAYDRYREEIVNAPRELDQAAEAVREWNGLITKESVGATLFRFWRMAYAEKYPAALGEEQADTFPKTEKIIWKRMVANIFAYAVSCLCL